MQGRLKQAYITLDTYAHADTTVGIIKGPLKHPVKA